MPVDLGRVKALFLEALERPAHERAAYLDAACAGDVELRQRLDAMLRANDASGELLPDVTGDFRRDGDPDVTLRDDDLAQVLQPAVTADTLGRLGHYDVLEILGKGGFGTVFKAHDVKLRRIVAIKVLAPELAANGSARKRFIREAQAAAAIKNEHVVAIYNVEDEHQPPYIVMEMIDGISLQDRIDQSGSLDLKEILRIGLQIAEGLASAHKQGLIHRDIKPANILLENGVQRVKITDFGLARLSDDASITQSGVIAGTPMYMAPEQAMGDHLDHRADLFSLGSVLYTLCAGHPPFRAANTMAVLKRVCDETPRPIRDVNPELPDWLSDVIAKLHAKKPDERYATAREVAGVLGDKLAELQSRGTVRAGSVSDGPTTTAPSVADASGSVKKRSLVAVAAVAVLTALLAVIFWPRGDDVSDPPEKNEPVVKDKDEWVQLFNGKDLTGWKPLPEAAGNWRVEDGVLVGSGPAISSYLHSERGDYENFHLRIEARLEGDTDIGSVIFRAGLESDEYKWGSRSIRSPLLEVALWFSEGDPVRQPGNLDIDRRGWICGTPRLARPKEWFTLEVIANGTDVITKLNGELAVQTNKAGGRRRGYILLKQFGQATVVHFRKIEIKELPPLSPEESPFVILSQGGRAETRHPTLAAAVAAAQSGDTVEVRGNGPFVTEPITIVGKALSIVAAPSYRPLLRLRSSKALRGQLIPAFVGTDSALALSGLALSARDLDPFKDNDTDHFFFVHAVKGSVSMANCRCDAFRGLGVGGGISGVFAVALNEGASASLVNCEFLTMGVVSAYASKEQVRIEAKNSTSFGSLHFFVHRQAEQAKPMELVLERNTFIHYWQDARLLTLSNYPQADVPKAEVPPFRFEANGNVFAGAVHLNWLRPKDDPVTADELEKFFRSLVKVEGGDNVYPSSRQAKRLLLMTQGWKDPEPEKAFSLGDWQRFWKLKVTDTADKDILFANTLNVHELLWQGKHDELGAANFRLAKGSPGQDVLPGGKDLGADVDLVGPGEPYERWKKTPAYKEWRKKTDALMTTAAAPQPFVVPAKAGRGETRHPTLAAAVAAAQSGDTIEIRGDGPFTTPRIEINGKALCIRAGDGFSPVVRLHPAAPVAMIRTDSALTLEGIELRREAPDDKHWPYHAISAFGPSIRLAQCRILVKGWGSAIDSGSALREVRGSDLRTPTACVGGPISKGQFTFIEGSILSGTPCDLYQFDPKPLDARLTCRRSTMAVWVGTKWDFWKVLPAFPPGLKKDEKARFLTVGFEENVVACGSVLALAHAGGRLPAKDAEAILRRGLDWKDRRNLFRPMERFVFTGPVDPLPLPEAAPIKTLAEWDKLHGAKDSGNLQGAIRFVGGDPAKGVLDWATSDFRLVKGSPGQGVLPDGKDLGADVDKVGPGEAYEKWKKTPEYKEWRKKTDALMAAPGP